MVLDWKACCGTMLKSPKENTIYFHHTFATCQKSKVRSNINIMKYLSLIYIYISMVDLEVRSHQKSIYKYILIISMLKAFCL